MAHHPTSIAVIAMLFFLSFMAGCAYKNEKADLVVHNARIHTMDRSMRIQEAMAVKDGKVIETGAERQILNKYQAERTYDAGMHPVYPGFNDAHSHFLWYGLTRQQVDLTDVASFETMLAKLEEQSGKGSGAWLIGWGWDEEQWPSLPDHPIEKLDSLFPEKPVFLRRVDGHAALVNHAALRQAGVPEEELTGLEGVGTKKGLFTGSLLDQAMKQVSDAIPEPSRQEQKQALLEAQEDCFRHGITSVTDAGLHGDEVDLIRDLQQNGDLRIRVNAMLLATDANFDRFLEQGPFEEGRLKVNAFKFFADGALGSRGALLLEPYANADTYGEQQHDRSYFLEKAKAIDKQGFQMCTHCIGDSAVRMMLDVYGEVLDGVNDKRWRIEHAQVVHPEDLDKFKQHTVIPSVQPAHAISDMEWVRERLGPERMERAYRNKDLLEQNGFLPLGTDFPVEPVDPMRTFYTAVARKNEQGEPEGGFYPGQAISREQALKGMALWPAMAAFEEDEKGTLEKGKVADMVVLEHDLLKMPIDKVPGNKVRATFVDGEQVYER